MVDSISVAFFALGTISASFVGVVVARLNTGQSFFVGRSRCDSCGTVLAPLSLVPIISYIASRGYSQCCDTRISITSPITEALLGTLFVLAYLNLGISFTLFCMLVSLSLLLALVLYDLTHQILPSSLLVAFIISATATGFLSALSLESFFASCLVAIALAGSLLAIHFFSRGRAMGFADAPLTLGLALLTGPSALFGYLFSFWIGAVIGIVILLRRPAGSRMGVEVPFAPYLAAGFLLAYFTQWNPFILIAGLS